MTRILIVEDDAHLAAGLRYSLERAGYEVLHAGSGPDGLRTAQEHNPDLMILDLMLPGLHGFGLLEKLRAKGARTPVIILSAKDEEVDKIRGFDAGADDYMSKPFGMGELLARIRARLPAAAKDGFRCGEGTVHLDAFTFELRGETVALTPTEVDILRALHRESGRPVPRDELLRSIWGLTRSNTRTLDTHVRRLRSKLERDPSHPEHIVTVHGVGYRFDP